MKIFTIDEPTQYYLQKQISGIASLSFALETAMFGASNEHIRATDFKDAMRIFVESLFDLEKDIDEAFSEKDQDCIIKISEMLNSKERCKPC